MYVVILISGSVYQLVQIQTQMVGVNTDGWCSTISHTLAYHGTLPTRKMTIPCCHLVSQQGLYTLAQLRKNSWLVAPPLPKENRSHIFNSDKVINRSALR